MLVLASRHDRAELLDTTMKFVKAAEQEFETAREKEGRDLHHSPFITAFVFMIQILRILRLATATSCLRAHCLSTCI